MVTKGRAIERKIEDVIWYLENKCGCICKWDTNKHHKITFHVPGTDVSGVVTSSKTPSVDFNVWQRHLKRDLRYELRRAGVEENNINTLRSDYLSFFTGTDDGKEKLSQLESLVKFCSSKTKLNDEQIKELYDDKLEGLTIKQLVEKYSVSKSTIYRYLNEISDGKLV
jgi:hypothetical protein